MNRPTLLAAAAIGAVLAAGTAPALAQSNTLDEMRREQANPGTSWVPAQNRAAAEADSMGRQDVGRWLAQADQALRGNRTGQAMELLERAETRMLSRSVPVTMSGRPMQDPVVDNISAARRALSTRDRGGAMQSIAAAQSALGAMPRDDMASGASGTMMPAQGGGGSMMMRDHGHGSTSMSRADVFGLDAPRARAAGGVTLAQGGGGGGGGMGEQSGGLSGSTPGSPGTGTLGSTPQSTLGLSQQPAQGSAVPLAPNQGGRGAPVPGSGVQAPGGTGQMPGDVQRGAPMPGSSR